MIKYLGSKRILIPQILATINGLEYSKSVIDLFSGTSRVGHALKKSDRQVISNDMNAYANTISTCYVQADLEDVEHDARQLINEFNILPGKPGYFTETFCERSRFFQPKNGERVDAIREEILKKNLHHDLEAVVITSLMEAADRVDSTVAIQMAYLKQWAARSYNDLELRMPVVFPCAKNGKGSSYQLDAVNASLILNADVAYLDPPYNHHSYLGNYHIWESLVLWDKPEVYGIACKRLDVKDKKSVFNKKNEALQAITTIVENLKCKHIVISFNDEGHITRDQMESMLTMYGSVDIRSYDSKRYVGSKIGIHNQHGIKVGSIGKSKNVEYIYILNKK